VRIDDLKAEFDRTQPLYERLAEQVKHALISCLKADEVKVDRVTSRVKKWCRFRKKASEKLQAQEWHDPFAKCVDRAGCRVVCLYRGDMARVEEAMGRPPDPLSVVSVDKKDEDPKAFGYADWHFVVEIPDSWRGPQYTGLHGLKCEVQVRTLGMHAWDSVSHHVQYEDPDALPPELKPGLDALSGLFRVADELFEMFRESARRRRDGFSHDLGQEGATGEMPIDSDSLAAYLGRAFPDDPPSPPGLLSGAVQKALEFGYTRISDVSERVERARPHLEEAEAIIAPKMGWLNSILYQGTYLVIALGLVEPRYIATDDFWAPCREDIEAFIKEHHLHDQEAT
jgi:ppGpp synthetase/RelA/SpoT-type nucleotidyltranferase